MCASNGFQGDKAYWTKKAGAVEIDVSSCATIIDDMHRVVCDLDSVRDQADGEL